MKSNGAMRRRSVVYVVTRDGRFLQQRAVVRGFLWQTSGLAWVREPRRATRFPRTPARQVAREHGGRVMALVAGRRAR
jgi:hypothetical protein